MVDYGRWDRTKGGSAEAGLLPEDGLPTGRGEIRAWAIVMLVAILWTIPVLSLHRVSPRTLASAHGLLHVAIAQRFEQISVLSIPPENPFFAGYPISYYWFFHFAGAMITAVSGLDPLHAFEGVIVVSMAGLTICSAILGFVLFRSWVVGLVIGYLALAGTNPLGPAAALLRFLRHGSIVLQDDPNHLWGIAHPIFSLARVADPWGLYGPLINFYLNITSRPVALLFLMALSLFLYFAHRSRRRVPLIGVALSSALCAMFNPLIGLAAGASLLAGLTIWWVWEQLRVARDPQAQAPCNRSTLAAGCAIGVGLLLALPTFYHLFSLPRVGTEILVGSLARLETIILSGGLLVVLAFYGAWRCGKECRAYLVVLLAAAAFLLVVNVAVKLPVGNESNLFHAASVLLAVPASASILIPKEPGSKTHATAGLGRTLALILIFLPGLVIVLGSYVGRPPLPLGFEGSSLIRHPRESGLSRLYQWVREGTPKEAIFVVDPREPVIKMAGNVSEFPALTGRVIFTDFPTSYMVDRYPDTQLRFRLAVRLVSGVSLDEFEQDYVDHLNRPVYVVVHARDNPIKLERLRALYGAPAFCWMGIAVFRWEDTAKR